MKQKERDSHLYTFQPKINSSCNKAFERGKAVHTEEVSRQWKVVTNKEAQLLSEFKNKAGAVPLNVNAGDKVTVLEKRFGKTKYWCRVLIRGVEGLIPMHCLDGLSGFTRLYKSGRMQQAARDKRHKIEKIKADIKMCILN